MYAGVPKLEILFLGLYKDEAYADSFPYIKYPGLTIIQIGLIWGTLKCVIASQDYV